MWVEILSANPGPVADVLAGVAADLDETVRALRGLQSDDDDRRREGTEGIEDVLRRGNAGRVRVPGKHGTAPTAYEMVSVLISDRPGELAGIFADAGRAGVNVEDVRIEHATGQQAGLVQLMVEPSAAPDSVRRCASGAGRYGSSPGAAGPEGRCPQGCGDPPRHSVTLCGAGSHAPPSRPPRVPGRCPPPWKPVRPRPQ